MVHVSFTVAIPGRSLPDGNKAKCFKHFLVLFKMKMSRQLAIEQTVNAFLGVFLERFALRISQVLLGWQLFFCPLASSYSCHVSGRQDGSCHRQAGEIAFTLLQSPLCFSAFQKRLGVNIYYHI